MKYATTLLFGVAVTLFFALAYPHHLHFQEQYQLFLFDAGYVREVLSMPGGLADLAGRFLTQFFLFAWVGATLIALLLTGIQLLAYRLLRISGPEMLTYALSFIPSLLCCGFLCDDNALLSAPFALLIALAMALLLKNIASDNVRQAAMLVSIPVTYMLAGAFALPYSLMLIIAELRRGHSLRSLSVVAVMLIVALATPAAWHHLVTCSLLRLYTGPHYYREADEFPHWAWSIICAVPLLMLLPSKVRQWSPRRALIPFLAVWLVLMLAGGALVNALRSERQENIMAYDFMARNAQWNRIIQKAQQQAPRNQMAVVALNLALAQRDMLTEHMFEYPQNGIAGLLPNFESDYVSPLVTSEAFYRLGMINTAQRYVFEAQEAIPAFQKSARCYKRLAETNLINGAYEVARKYLIALQHTLFYRTWATETLALIADDEAVKAHPEYGTLRSMRCEQDYFFGGNALHQILARQMESNPQNRMAFEYLEAACLLAKDVDRAMQYYPLSEPLSYQAVPGEIQQAMLLLWSQNHRETEPIPDIFHPEMVKGFRNFHTTMQMTNGNRSAVQKSFGNTYWYYYFFQ